MQYVKVRYPTRRIVYIDGARNGYTNQVLRVDAGTHVFQLGNLANFEPAFRRVMVRDTTLLEPLEIAFRRKDGD